MTVVCIDRTFSTTRCLITEAPGDLRQLPANESRKGEGGLRTKGYYKRPRPDRPLISVITPVYNAARYLDKSVTSVLQQRYDNLEYFLIDGGSVDGTLDILKKYEDCVDYWISEPDEGIYDAMNKGLSTASGDWLYFLGADDILVDCLHKVAPYLRYRQCIYYGDVYLPRKNKVYGGEFKPHDLISKNINHQAIFYPRSVFEEYKYNLKYEVLADYELNIKCWGNSQFKFKYVPILVAIHNDEGHSFRTVDTEFEKDKLSLIRQSFSRQITLRTARLKVRRALIVFLETLGFRESLLRALSCARYLLRKT